MFRVVPLSGNDDRVMIVDTLEDVCRAVGKPYVSQDDAEQTALMLNIINQRSSSDPMDDELPCDMSALVRALD